MSFATPSTWAGVPLAPKTVARVSGSKYYESQPSLLEQRFLCFPYPEFCGYFQLRNSGRPTLANWMQRAIPVAAVPMLPDQEKSRKVRLLGYEISQESFIDIDTVLFLTYTAYTVFAVTTTADEAEHHIHHGR